MLGPFPTGSDVVGSYQKNPEFGVFPGSKITPVLPALVGSTFLVGRPTYQNVGV